LSRFADNDLPLSQEEQAKDNNTKYPFGCAIIIENMQSHHFLGIIIIQK